MTSQTNNQNILNWIKRIPTLILLVTCLSSLIWYALRLLRQSTISWSLLSVLFIGTALICAAYFAISLFRVSLQNINNYLCYFAIFMLIGLEIILQFMPELTPAPFMNYLPKKTVERIRIAVGHEWGYYTGEDMVYHYPPSQQMDYGELKRPFVHIDEEGFRNPDQSASEYDVVLLGDSMIFALDAKKDLADRFRAAGSSAINLGMEGYSPQQFRDVYKKYIIDRGIEHKYVLVFLYIGNDFSDAEAYQWIRDNRGDYTDYIIGDTYGNPRLPLTLNLLKGLPHFLSQNGQEIFEDGDFPPDPAAESEDTDDMIEGRIIELPYTNVEAHDWLWPPPSITSDDASWQMVSGALDDIITLANEAEATPLFFLLPSPLTVYSEFEVDPPPGNSLQKYDRNHAMTSGLLEEYALSRNVAFSDLDAPLKVEIENTFLFAAKDDGHFSDEGLDEVFKIVNDLLEQP